MHDQTESIPFLTSFSSFFIKITEEFYPWDPGQVVVELSRHQNHKMIIIVGDEKKAPERLWKTLCKANQWTRLIESIIGNLSVTVKGPSASTHTPSLVDVADDFPFRVCDQWVPASNSGYIYLLVSQTCPSQTYVGQTKNLAVRIRKHNAGYGAQGTQCYEYLPWSICSYISGTAYLSRTDRMQLEGLWQRMNRRSIENRQNNIEQLIENGYRVVKEHNDLTSSVPDLRLNYIVMAQRRFSLELGEPRVKVGTYT